MSPTRCYRVRQVSKEQLILSFSVLTCRHRLATERKNAFCALQRKKSTCVFSYDLFKALARIKLGILLGVSHDILSVFQNPRKYYSKSKNQWMIINAHVNCFLPLVVATKLPSKFHHGNMTCSSFRLYEHSRSPSNLTNSHALDL